MALIIGKSEVPLQKPGHLSAVTVAKGIEYGVKLLGCFIEGYVDSSQGLGKEADFGTMTRAALEFARGTFATCSEEHNWYEHFQLLMRHPVINAGVQIAAWHRTGCQRISSVPDPLQNSHNQMLSVMIKKRPRKKPWKAGPSFFSMC